MNPASSNITARNQHPATAQHVDVLDSALWQTTPSERDADEKSRLGMKCPGSFATIIAGEEYAALALCLHRQLRRQGSSCPLVVVYSDVDSGHRVSQRTLDRLAETVGPSNLIPLTKLVLRAQSHPSIAWPIGEQSEAGTSGEQPGLRKWTNAAQWGAGRLAYGVHKYWLWALDAERFPRVAYLDVDVLVLRNLDTLLFQEFSHGLAAVTSAPFCQARLFNSGVLVLKPSLATLVRLLLGHRFVNYPWKGRVPTYDDARLGRDGPLTMQWPKSLARDKHLGGVSPPTASPRRPLDIGWAEHCLPAGCSSFDCAPAATRSNAKLTATLGPNHTGFLSKCRVFHGGKYKLSRDHVKKACERHAWDQSVLNWFFAYRWHGLSKGYNVQSQTWELMHRRDQLGKHNISLIHFAGEPKPWGDADHLAQYGSHRRSAPPAKGWSQSFHRLAEKWRAACPAEVIGGGGLGDAGGAGASRKPRSGSRITRLIEAGGATAVAALTAV